MVVCSSRMSFGRLGSPMPPTLQVVHCRNNVDLGMTNMPGEHGCLGRGGGEVECSGIGGGRRGPSITTSLLCRWQHRARYRNDAGIL